ncbi:MAG: acetylornithine carbamoyltransferase [Bacteroidota bacterium]
MQQYLSIHDVDDLASLVAEAKQLKANPLAHEQLGRQKTLVLLFMNPSLRTRLSTQKAAQNLGMNCIVMNLQQGWKLEFEDGAVMNLDRAEHIKEAAAVISQYADIIGILSSIGQRRKATDSNNISVLTDRAKDYEDFLIHQLVRHASVPVVSLESAIRHPLQSLADALTIEERKKTTRPKVVLTWAPHLKALPQAVSNSFVEFMQAADVELTITNPEGYDLAPQFVKETPILHDQLAAFKDADFIYAKNWSAFEPYGQILGKHEDWIINTDKMALTNQGKFMHCLPVRRNVVVADEVLDSEASLVIEQANNRTFAAQTVLKKMLEFKP